jgi:hypothetical protein
MTAYNHDMGISVEILYSDEWTTGEQVPAPGSSQDWEGQPLCEGDLIEKPGFSGPEWYVLVPKAPPRGRANKYNPPTGGMPWKLGHRD